MSEKCAISMQGWRRDEEEEGELIKRVSGIQTDEGSDMLVWRGVMKRV